MSEPGQRKFTVVCEFRGGTYLAQIHAENVIEAVRNWSDYMARERPIARSSGRLAKNALRGLDELGPTPIETLTGVWFIYVPCGGEGAFINLIDSAL